MADIAFSCASCGQILEGPAELANTVVECPACFNSILVPDAEPAPVAEIEPVLSPAAIMATVVEMDGADVEGPACPECGNAMEEGSVLCVECGFHTALGRKIATDLS